MKNFFDRRDKKDDRFTFLELVNDSTLIGVGFLTFNFDWSNRSLFAVFFQKEDRVILIDLLYINFEIKVK